MLRLKIYTDEYLTEVKETREVERMKVPYGVTKYVLNALQGFDLNDNMQAFRRIVSSEAQLTAVVRATFGLSEEELACIDTVELAGLANEIIGFVLDKMAELGLSLDDDAPNGQTPAATA